MAEETIGRSSNSCNVDGLEDTSRDAFEQQSRSDALESPVTVTIHGVRYDISNFEHPGGPAWLKSVAGQDATTHFEAHHMRISRARARLATLPVVSKSCASFGYGCNWDWSEAGFYATVRRRAAAALLAEIGQATSSESDVAMVTKETWRQATSSTTAMRVTRIVALALYITTFLATCVTRSPWMALACGVMTAVMGGFGHNAFHQRGHSWDCWLFECAGLSHEAWRVGDHTEHHMNPNLPGDPDAEGMLPLVVWGPPTGGISVWRMFRCIFSPLAFHIVAATGVLLMQIQHLGCPDVGKRDARRSSGLVAPLVMLCMLTVSGWLWSVPGELFGGGMLHSLGMWLLTWTFGSFYFMTVTNVSHNQERNWIHQPCGQDWGAWQLATATDISVPFGLRGVPLCGMMFMFLHEQSLHHLFPALDHSRLPCIRPVVQRTAEEFGLTLHPPRNFIRLYLGMLATAAGISVSKAQALMCRSEPPVSEREVQGRG